MRNVALALFIPALLLGTPAHAVTRANPQTAANVSPKRLKNCRNASGRSSRCITSKN